MKRACVLLLLLLPLAIAADPSPEDRLLSRVRQLTFVGSRAGEGYFASDGKALVFQSEREPGNPFYQIYRLDLETGETSRLSPGWGKTTCGWIYPGGKHVLFASTHLDPRSRELQAQELEFRASGQKRRYSWDFDPQFELFRAGPNGELQRLTDVPGYDAEGSVSPDGRSIVFASNRSAYPGDPGQDPSYFVDVYRMPAEGGPAERLTDSPGYDGGPFYSADGRKICWRRFSADGSTSEVYTMDADGSNQRQLTRLDAMSWAPFFHPSGKYLLFATNLQGHANFELYMVDAEGRRDPVRVTGTDGFDGLPAFSPDGAVLAWTSNRTPDGTSQIIMADWNHAAALALLGLEPATAAASKEPPAAIPPEALRKHVVHLASEDMQGRHTGTTGEQRAAEYIASVFRSLGLEPAGDAGSFFQKFEFTAGVSPGPGNRLSLGRNLAMDREWRPVGFSGTGDFPAAPAVFAGYGIVVPAENGQPAYDSYGELEVRDRWVVVLRYSPEDVPPERRSQLKRYASLRRKATEARDRGARGLIVVSPKLIPLASDASLGGTSIAVLSLTEGVAAAELLPELGSLTGRIGKGEIVGLPIENSRISASVDLIQEKRFGINVLARLAGTEGQAGAVVVGGHYDHLGRGEGSSSLAKEEEQHAIHYGADDNASGVAALLEIARMLSREGAPRRDVLFAAWSGEELGNLGSSRFLEGLPDGALAAYLNMDMIGRMDRQVMIQGVGSSSEWPSWIERVNAPLGLSLRLQSTPYLPTDASAFYLKKVPVLSAFTGAHSEYHTPRDTPDLLNYAGIGRIAQLVARLAEQLAQTSELPRYVAVEKPAGAGAGSRAELRAYLGTIPDYAQGEGKGVRLSGVASGGPAETAGVAAGDTIVELAGHKVENLYDYSFAIEALKAGQPAAIVVERQGRRLELKITPTARE
ncbi:MAG: M20/M25/M40 family metallo-hydrolase [Armatimonadetes bacterium]|nr:M20/M25/M40 family metallo-hydrolase [Armatimonadota bacterium]